MEKFSLFPSFVSSSTFTNSATGEDLSPKNATPFSDKDASTKQKAPDFSQKEAFFNALKNSDDDEENVSPPTLHRGSDEVKNTNSLSPNAMLSILSLHEQKTNKIKGR